MSPQDKSQVRGVHLLAVAEVQQMDRWARHEPPVGLGPWFETPVHERGKRNSGLFRMDRLPGPGEGGLRGL
jgi:hypothetical protein